MKVWSLQWSTNMIADTCLLLTQQSKADSLDFSEAQHAPSSTI